MPKLSFLSSDKYDPQISSSNPNRFYLGISFMERSVIPERIQYFDLGAYTSSRADALSLYTKLIDNSCKLIVIIDRVKQKLIKYN